MSPGSSGPPAATRPAECRGRRRPTGGGYRRRSGGAEVSTAELALADPDLSHCGDRATRGNHAGVPARPALHRLLPLPEPAQPVARRPRTDRVRPVRPQAAARLRRAAPGCRGGAPCRPRHGSGLLRAGLQARGQAVAGGAHRGPCPARRLPAAGRAEHHVRCVVTGGAGRHGLGTARTWVAATAPRGGSGAVTRCRSAAAAGVGHDGGTRAGVPAGDRVAPPGSVACYRQAGRSVPRLLGVRGRRLRRLLLRGDRPRGAQRRRGECPVWAGRGQRPTVPGCG